MNVLVLRARRALFVVLLLFLAVAMAAPDDSAASSVPDAPVPGAAAKQGALFGAMLAGEYAEATGHPQDAVRYDMQALALDPGNQTLLQHGFIAALLANSPDALRLAPLMPGNALAAMLRGNQAVRQKDFKAAASDYAAMPEGGLTGLIRPLLIAWSQDGAGDTSSAIDRLKSLAPVPPFGPVYALNAALIADLAGRIPVAATFYRMAEAAFPVPNLRLGEALASWQARQGNKTAADHILTGMVAAHPDLTLALPAMRKQAARPILHDAREGIAETYLSLAGSLNQPEQMLLQQSLLRFALELRPDLDAARMLLADIQATEGKSSEAVATLHAVTPDRVLYLPAAMREASLLAGLGKTAQAVALLKTITAALPHELVPLKLQADIQRDAGQYAAAKALYTQALAGFGVATPPDSWSLYYGRAICEDKMGNWPAARADLQQARALAPRQPYVLNYLGYSYAIRGIHLKRAQRMIEQALQIVPDDGGIIDSLGYILLREGKISQALRAQIRAVQLSPDDPEVNAHLGDIFFAAGDRLAARYQWGRALALKPDAKLRAHLEASLKHDKIAPVKF